MIEVKLRGRIQTPTQLTVKMDSEPRMSAVMNANAVSTTNYNELGNKPKINGNLLYGDKTSAELGIALSVESDGNGNITLVI